MKIQAALNPKPKQPGQKKHISWRLRVGTSHEDSSFYLALHSEWVVGTVMVLDEQADRVEICGLRARTG